MISYAEEYEKVYSYKCRHKIYENPLHPSNLNMNLMTHFNENNQRKHYKTDNNFYKNENFKDFYRSRAIFSAYLKQRYKKRDDRGVSENLQNMEKANKFFFIDHSSRNFIVNYKDFSLIPSNKFQNFHKESDEIKAINRKISIEKHKIVQDFIKNSEKQQKVLETTNYGFEFLTNIPITKEKRDISLTEVEINQESPHNQLENTLNKNSGLQIGNSEGNSQILKKQKKKKRNFLCINAKTNSVQKFGRPKNKEDHLHRVLTRENTPCAKYHLQPVLINKKETSRRELNAYFSDYRPFLQGDLANLPKRFEIEKEVGLNDKLRSNAICLDTGKR